MADDVSEFWFWSTPDGALKTFERAELVASLSRGDIPPAAFVWKQGWAEWLQAAQVAELSSALAPSARQAAVSPKLSPDATHPPPVPPADGRPALAPIVPVASNPQNDKPTTQLLDDSELLSVTDLEPVKEPPRAKSAPPPLKASTPPRPGDAPPSSNWKEVSAPKIESATAAAPVPQTAPIVPVDSSPRNDPPTGQIDAIDIEFVDEKPSLADLEAEVAKNRPSKPSPVIAVGASDNLPTQRDNPVISAPAVAVPENAIVPVSDPDNEAPTTVQASPLQEAADAAPLPSWSAEVDAEMHAAQRPAAGTPYAPPPQVDARASMASDMAIPGVPKKSGGMGLLLGGVAVVGLLGVATVAAGLWYFKPWESTDASAAKTAPTTTESAAAAAPPAEASSTTACSVAKQGKRIAGSVLVSVPPYLAEVPGTSTLAIGYAESSSVGIGLTVDPATLEFKQAYSRAGTKNVVGVVPTTASGELGFTVDREDSPLKVPHTVDAKTPFVIGMGPQGYSRLNEGGTPELLWEGGVGEKITEPRVASVDGVGHAVTFRRGGRVGEVHVGWLAADGTKKTSLVAIEAEGPRVGTPNIAANQDSVLVAFAARPADDAPWGVRLAQAAHGEPAKTSSKFELPSGGPGGEAISPTVAGLPGKRWLLQWTEGKSGERTVRAQTLDSKLQPLGEPMTLSPKGMEAGQGAVGVRGDSAAAFYLVKASSGYELWATGLSCN